MPPVDAAMPAAERPTLEVRGLVTEFDVPGAPPVRAVDGVSFDVRAGEVFGLVGESGCGKTATCRSVIQLFAGAAARIAGGSIRLDGQELVGLPPRALAAVRGRRVSMVFQDPMTSLNPTMRIGQQLAEALGAAGVARGDARTQAVALLRAMHVPEPEQRLRVYPHELSGGLRQRVVIAMALAARPRLLLADEPTTALDVTVQQQILRLLLEARAERGMAMLLVSHDLGVIAQTCDRMAVMYAGRIVETGTVAQVLGAPRHPYTRALLAALPARAARPGHALRPIPGTPPSLAAPPPGCRFRPRCEDAIAPCAGYACALRESVTGSGHFDACERAHRAAGAEPEPEPATAEPAAQGNAHAAAPRGTPP